MPTTVTVHPPRSFIDRYFLFQPEDNWVRIAGKIVNWLLIIPFFGLNVLALAFYDVWRWDAHTDIDLPPRLPFGLFANLFPRRSHLSGNPIVPIRVTGHYRAPQYVRAPLSYVPPFLAGSVPPLPPPAMPTPPLAHHQVARDVAPRWGMAPPPAAHASVAPVPRPPVFQAPPPPPAHPTPAGQRAVVGGAVENPHRSRGGPSAQPARDGLSGTSGVAFPPPPGIYAPQAPHMGGAPGAPPYRYPVGARQG
ncbi:MAG: hypothetical protein JSR76_00880 [Verrucomicrobia bacterium]|nr:hypothetical protein [Verrucomicrobiota bacterium]